MLKGLLRLTHLPASRTLKIARDAARNAFQPRIIFPENQDVCEG